MQRITVETAKLAAEKGYRDNPWEEDYHKTAYQAELQDWLRTVHNIYVCIELKYVAPHDLAVGKTTRYHASFYSTKDGTSICPYSRTYNTYEEAFEVGLQEALKLIKL